MSNQSQIIVQFPYYNIYAIEVWEWINNFIQHFIMDVITYPWDEKLSHIIKRGLSSVSLE